MNGKFLENKNLQLILFGGKGGTGKTTAAAATSVYLAQHNSQKRILVASTDPAHSLSDSFGQYIGREVTQIQDIPNLWALEIDAERLLIEFKRSHKLAIKKVLSRGTYLDEEDIANFFELSLPGLDEIMAIMEIAKVYKNGRYDLIILDTAPTGHTVRLLSLPEKMKEWIRIFDIMQGKYRYLSRRFTGRYVKDDVDLFLGTMARDIKQVKELLTNPQKTEFIPVTIPEAMSINETERLIQVLEANEIRVRYVIINRIAVDEGSPFCVSRKESQVREIENIESLFSRYDLIKVPLFPTEIRGIEKLKDFAEALFGGEPKHEIAHPLNFEPLGYALPEVKMSDIPKQDFKFILFGGKGGVGKTSVAAATALHLAKDKPEKKILLFSTDPAHSLSDSFNFAIGDKVTSIPGAANLFAVEIDAAVLFEDLKRRYREDIEKVFNSLLADGVSLRFDREIIRELISLSPPGLDEIMALSKIIDFKRNGLYDVFILDTAPTGHLIRFLELPALASDWLKTILKLLLKYKQVVSLGKAAEQALDLAQAVREMREILTDPTETEFVTVTIPEAMAVMETKKLLKSLQWLEIPCHHIVVNMVVPQTAHCFCSLMRQEQQKYISEIEAELSADYKVVQVPLFEHEIRGISDLSRLADVLYGESANCLFSQVPVWSDCT